MLYNESKHDIPKPYKYTGELGFVLKTTTTTTTTTTTLQGWRRKEFQSG
jgi:hypothetical protein